MNRKVLIIILLFSYCGCVMAQQNSVAITAVLDAKAATLKIKQKIIFHNQSKDTLNEIYLHNWANSFKDRTTPLSKRFIEDYDKSFYFSKKQEKGYTIIHNIGIDFQSVTFQEVKNQADILKIKLPKPLFPGGSTTILVSYTEKIPSARFTGYGKTKTGYALRFWYLIPAVYQKGWQLMSNLNMDDLFMKPTDYTVDFKVPSQYFLESNLPYSKSEDGIYKSYHLNDKSSTDIIVYITKKEHFSVFKAANIAVKTDISTAKIDNRILTKWFKKDTANLKKNIDHRIITKVLRKQLDFIADYVGAYPHRQIFVDNLTVNKNKIQKLFRIPDIFKPFSDVFLWDIAFFKALSKKYIEEVLFFNKRKDYWFLNGLQTFLLMEYVKKYYPKIKLLGRFANFWGIRNFTIAKLHYNDKYPFVYQFSARKFLDQSLDTPAALLSNFNRKIVSKYKAGLGFSYLEGVVGDSILKQSIKDFYRQNRLKITKSITFEKILRAKTNRDLQWFFGDYIHTSKKIDYTIKKVKPQGSDSIAVTIKNKRNMIAPVALYGVKDKKIKFKQWIFKIDSTKTIVIPKGNFDRLALNYEQLYPEYNSLDNWKSLHNGLLNKPLQIKFWKDIGDPYYYQLYYQPNVKYNYYDGLILGVRLHNRPILIHNLEFSFTPNYATKTNSLTGGFSVAYNQYFEKSKIYKISYGIAGSNYHYDKNLAYKYFSPAVNIIFKRNSLRDVGSKYLLTRWIDIDKEVPYGQSKKERDRYRILNFRYVYSKPDIIRNFEYALNTEFANDFTKFSADIRYQKLTDNNRNLSFRFFGGFFLNNSSKGDYFSYSLDRGSDYLFEQNLFGRSESSGLFSQQFTVTDGGFKSFFKHKFANQFLFSVNTSVSIWRWIESYNDVAMYKSRGKNTRFAYENGIRLNFIPSIFEFYFPLYTNKGWEIQSNYSSKIRFIITTNLSAIYNFIRRGIL